MHLVNELPPGLVALLMILREWAITLRLALLLLIAAVPIMLDLFYGNGALLGVLGVLLGLAGKRSTLSSKIRPSPRRTDSMHSSEVQQPRIPAPNLSYPPMHDRCA